MSNIPRLANSTPQSDAGGYASQRYDGRLTVAFVVLYFMPYYPGTNFRADQFIGLGYLFIFMTSFFSIRAGGRDGAATSMLGAFAFLSIAYISLRMFFDGKFDSGVAKVFNYQVHLAAGFSIYVFHRDRFLETRHALVNSILAISLVTSAITIFQFYFTDHPLTSFLLEIFNGRGDVDYANDYSDFETIAALEVLSKTSMTSIFTGKHSLAVFDLLVIALATGAYNEDGCDRARKGFLNLVIFLALVSGWMSTSKIFVFGIVVFVFLGLDLANLVAKRAISTFVVFCLAIGSLSVLSTELRVLDNLIETVLSGNFIDIFSSRYGGGIDIGYLADKMEILYDPITVFFGQGAWAGYYTLSDSQFRSIFLVGGLPYFLLTYAFVGYLLIITWRAIKYQPYARPLFGFGMAILLGGTGIECYWQARVVPLWIICNLLLVSRASASSPKI